MNFNQMFRMARWARNPPPMRKVIMMLAIAAIVGGIAYLDKAGLLPDWMDAQTRRLR